MAIDQDRIRAIREAEHSFYGGRDIPIRIDDRWKPYWENLFTPRLSPTMRVLDVGCGKGHFLLELSANFQSGLGIDIDPAHIQMAEERKLDQGIQNVDFRLLDYPSKVTQLDPESFDMVVSHRGPLADTEGIRAAYQLLCTDGMLFCEEIAEHHHKEVSDVFGEVSKDELIPKVNALREILKQNGFDVRLAADVYTKWFYPDVYAWYEFICNIWTWLGIPLPEPDDPRIGLFAERNTASTGEIETTHHIAWVAGVKL
jgi:SAM-dependent methyltransferase